MIFKSTSERTLEKADRMLKRTNRWALARLKAGGLSPEEQLQFRKEMDTTFELVDLSAAQSKTSPLGDLEAALRRLFREVACPAFCTK